MSARDRIADVLARAYDGTPLAELRDEHAAHHRKAADLLLATEWTAYRAEHDSIVMGLYTTASEARAHCVAEERLAWAKFSPPVFDWIEDDEDGVAELVTVDEDGGTETITGYVVTPLTVASEYDPDADE